jgi:hypothetical protein
MITPKKEGTGRQYKQRREMKNKYGETSRFKIARHSCNEDHRIHWDKAKIIYKE